MEVEPKVVNENWWEVEEPPRVRPVPKVDFWEGFGGITSGAALMVDWGWYFGSSLDLIKPFLRPTAELATSYPCISHPVCDCRHELVEEGEKWLSVCSRPGECFCERDCVELELKDLVIYGLDWGRLGSGIRGALGLGEANGPAYSTMWLREIGVGPLRAPVYFSSAERDTLLRELMRLFGLRDGPLVLLTPTGWACSQEVEEALRRVSHCRWRRRRRWCPWWCQHCCRQTARGRGRWWQVSQFPGQRSGCRCRAGSRKRWSTGGSLGMSPRAWAKSQLAILRLPCCRRESPG